MNYRKFQSQRVYLHFFSLPFIWLPLIALLLLDILITLFQAICFPIYKIEKVKRSPYIQIIDRNKLAYLNIFEKVGCMYCGYANGFLLYAKEIAVRTEKYWCGIKHAAKPGFKPQVDQEEQDFAVFGDEADFHKKYGA